jgi:O-antigen/teichoic acid export membrane protein
MFPFAAFNQFAGFYVLVPRNKDRLLAIAGVASGLANLAAALYLAPRHGAIGMALARVIGEATLSLLLLCFTAGSGLLSDILPTSLRDVLAKGPLAEWSGK